MNRERVRILVRGAVQGVGFRPFVHRLANELALRGYVLNSNVGVTIEVEGDSVREFLSRFEKEKPPRAILQSIETSFLDPRGYEKFEVRPSTDLGAKTALILPDIATCADCLRDILDSDNRRFRYPFTNCTNCGPRFSIIEALPYDRANTSMKKFTMCQECEREYQDPNDRRFHAQPNACPACGPQLQLLDSLGKNLAAKNGALLHAAEILRAGKILALKGLGGFQLLVDARNEEAVVSLRERKHRAEKPFAVMFPSLEKARASCDISALEERLLLSPESPIVLLKRRAPLPHSLAPGNPNLGVMLPYTPLHHLLLRELDFPVVATSGNLSDEPICIDETEALERLHNIAAFFLVHDRPIVRHVDDSIARIIHDREMILRRARGYAPLPISLRYPVASVLAVGAHLKNTVALGVDKNIFVSQHIGDLETAQAHQAFRATAADLPRLYDVKPATIACDLHPEYLSTKFARESGARVHEVQHHWAHIAACMAENEIEAPALGVAWDGTGFGGDETIWGGEFLLPNESSFSRVAHLRPFRLPGGEAAIKEPRRSALGILHEVFADELWSQHDLLRDFSESEITPLRQMLERKINAPLTSSAGRLFDAVAALIGLRARSSFEGQAAMELEFVLHSPGDGVYPFTLEEKTPLVLDWTPMILAIREDVRGKLGAAAISMKFHNTMAEMIVAVAHKVGERKVVLSGGCFQNRYLTERTIDRLRAESFRPYWHQRIPPNDGGISLGQVVATNWSSA